MAKNLLWFVIVIVVGALLGSFLGSLIGAVFHPGTMRNLLMTELAAGLRPTSLDLRIVELTFGCMFKVNILAIIGIAVAALLFKNYAK